MNSIENCYNDNKKYTVRVQSVIEDIQNGLSKTADEYYKSGINLYKIYESSLGNDNTHKAGFQVITGNLAISIELILKSIIAKETFVFLYKGLSDDAAMGLTYPEKVKTYNFISELLSFKESKTIEFKEAVSRFFKLFPEQKKEFSSYLENLPDIRNNSVHAYVPAYNHRHFMDKVIFISMKLKEFRNQRYEQDPHLDQFEKDFIENYEQEKMDNYQEKIKKAQQKTKNIHINDNDIVSDTEWDKYQITCPVCKSNAVLLGECNQIDDIDQVLEPDGQMYLLFNEKLIFTPMGFECYACDLKLHDIKELELAGLEQDIDRSEYVDLWSRQSLGLE